MATPFDLALSSYLDHLRIERSLSPHSIAGYQRDLLRYQGLLRSSSQNYSQITEDKFGEIVGQLSIAGLSPSSINRFISSIKGFYRYCLIEYQLPNSLVDFKQFRIARKLPKALSIAEIDSLIKATLNPADPSSLRDTLIVELLYGTGARVSELVGIDIGDITQESLAGEEIAVIKLRGKGSKERLVPIGKFALEALDNYLIRLRPGLLAKNSQSERALILNSRGSRLTRQSAWSALLKAAVSVGLEGRVSPHIFRHSYATHLLDGGADIRVVQELLGHASVTTTQIYTLVTIDKVRESYSAAHPRANF